MTQSEETRWSWMGASGAETSGDEWDLLAAMKSGEITPQTMVWRRTWLDWLPACRVAELAHLLPAGAALPALSPRRSESAMRPPPRIIDASPSNAPSSFGTLGHRRPLGPPRPLGAGGPARAAQPTIDDEVRDAQGTLRPPGAVPPPPRPVAGGSELSTPRGPALGSTVALKPTSSSLGQAAVLGQTSVLGPRQPQHTLVGVGAGEGTPLPPRHFNQTLRLGEPPRPVAPAASARAPLGQTLPLAAQPSPPPMPEYPTAEVLPPAPLVPPPHPYASAAPVAAPYAPAAHAPAAHAPYAAPAALPYAQQPAAPYNPPSAPDAVPLHPRSHAVETPPREGSERAKLRGTTPLLLAGGALILLAAAAGGALLVTKHRSAAAALPRASALPAAAPKQRPAAPASAGCELLHPAARLAPDFYRRVVPAFALATDGQRVAVGFAETKNKAIGVVVDPATLASELSFSETTKAQVSAVVPHFQSGKATFAIDSDRTSLRGTRTIPNTQLAIALAGADLVQVTDTEPRVVIQDAAPGKSTDPRVVSSGGSHLVSFRRGGLQGDVAYAFLTSDGKLAGELRALRSDESAMSGTPDAALEGPRFLLGFAGRAASDQPWQVFLASGKKDGEAPPITRFRTPPGGLGGGSIAPAVAALPDGRWALSWTEGKAPQYEVRLQALEADLTPRGEPLLASPKGANAGQASLFAMGSTLFSVFVQSTAGHDELWAATFRCE